MLEWKRRNQIPVKEWERRSKDGDAAERRSSFALRATEYKYDRGDQATRWSDGRWRLKIAAVWYNFNVRARSEDEET